MRLNANSQATSGPVECYWMVHGNGPTNHRHGSPHAAIMEAKRLAEQHPGTVFRVLQVVDAYLVPAPGAQRLEVFGNEFGDDLPF